MDSKELAKLYAAQMAKEFLVHFRHLRLAPGLDQIDWGLNSSSHTYRGRNDLPGN
jgi:hypothetical protein